MPPFLLQHGTSDRTVPYLQSLHFVEKLAPVIGAENITLDLLEGARHADDRFATPENLDRVFGFLEKHLRENTGSAAQSYAYMTKLHAAQSAGQTALQNNYLGTDFNTGSVSRKLLTFSVPIMFANLMQVLYNIVDMMVVGKFVESVGISAVANGGISLAWRQ